MITQGHTVGVVLVVPDPVGAHVAAVRAEVEDSRAAVMPSHVTLLPPTVVPTGVLSAFVDHLAEVSRCHRALSIGVCGSDTFRPVTDVVYLSLGEGAQECVALGAAVCAGPVLSPSPYAFHPHITLAHDLAPAVLDAVQASHRDFVASFEVSQMFLYRLDDEAGWQVQERYPLVG